jgi:hypothetical protein
MDHLPHVYLAGKIARSDWRTELVEMPTWIEGNAFPRLPMKGVPAVCTGPIYQEMGGHGVAHGPNQHGTMMADNHGWVAEDDRTETVRRCLGAVQRSDFVFAWIADLTCYGSLVEIGFAHAVGVPVYIGVMYGVSHEDIWFASEVAGGVTVGSDPVAAMREMLAIHADRLRTMPYADYLRTNEWSRRRQMALTAADARCQLCNSTDRLHVHHRTYERRGCELPSDLTVLCQSCHAKFHDKIPAPPIPLRDRVRDASTGSR